MNRRITGLQYPPGHPRVSRSLQNIADFTGVSSFPYLTLPQELCRYHRCVLSPIVFFSTNSGRCPRAYGVHAADFFRVSQSPTLRPSRPVDQMLPCPDLQSGSCEYGLHYYGFLSRSFTSFGAGKCADLERGSPDNGPVCSRMVQLEAHFELAPPLPLA